MAAYSLPNGMRRLVGTICVVWLCAWVPNTVRAEGETLYGALILATKVDHPAPPPEELRTQAKSLQTVFGYNEFRVLGRKREPVVKGTEDWLVPSRQFSLHVDTKNPIAGGYALGLELRQEERLVVQADVNLNRERPLFIRGPLVGEGQLIILLMVL